LEISKRHRMWGLALPAWDLDFVLVECNGYRPVALIEYKKHTAPQMKPTDPSLKPLIWMADRCQIPCYAVKYNTENWMFTVVPINKRAKGGTERSNMTEDDYVRFLYGLRGQEMPPDLDIGSPLYPKRPLDLVKTQA